VALSLLVVCYEVGVERIGLSVFFYQKHIPSGKKKRLNAASSNRLCKKISSSGPDPFLLIVHLLKRIGKPKSTSTIIMPKVRRENKGKRLRLAATELHGTIVSEASIDNKVEELKNDLKKDETKTPAILLQLESNVSAEREEACNALANIVLDVEEDQGN
jgi:hypothetical protein